MLGAALLACALHVHPDTTNAIIRRESRGDPYALNVNERRGFPRPPHPYPRSAVEAAATARAFIAAGYNVDIGLMQINSRNLPKLGYTIEQVLDPCTNLAAGATILHANYVKAATQFGLGQSALKAALSAYNTGNFSDGFTNGYVASIYDVPVLDSLSSSPPQPMVLKVQARTPAAEPRQPHNRYAADPQVWWGE